MGNQSIQVGSAWLSPASLSLEAGSFSTVEFIYQVGHPIDDTGYIKIVFRYAGDFGTPQFDQPEAANYCTVSTDGDCVIVPRWDPKGHTRPWGKALFLKITGGFLDHGEKVSVVFGDTAKGSPGWQIQTFCEKTFEFKTLVDPVATYQFKELPQSPTAKIVPGPAARAVCLAPSLIEINQPFVYWLKLEDRWGNPVVPLEEFSNPGYQEPGIYFVKAEDEKTGLSALSNPIRVEEKSSGRGYFWADFHGQSEETIGSNSIDDYFSFARDFSKLDIVCHQGNDFQVTDDFWRKINRVCQDFYDPGRLVTFPGYEWSGNTPLGGDRNIYFNSDKGKIARSSRDLLPHGESEFADAPDALELFRNLKAQNLECFTFAHVGGRFPDMSMHDENIELAVEIHSAWGTFEWLLQDALSQGYRIGICANSDGHKGRPGSSYPGASRFGSYGGLTCVLAEKLDRTSVFQAMKARHFYATTGTRCLIDLKVESAEHCAMMGDVINLSRNNEKLILNSSIAASAPIESVTVFNGSDTMKKLYAYHENELGGRIKILWSGAEVRGRARMVEWDGSLEIAGNEISDFHPVNFWNINKQITRRSSHSLSWRSITTGGLAGCILSLRNGCSGRLRLETSQGKVGLDLAELAVGARDFHFGGLEKKISVYRLPDKLRQQEFSFALPLDNLHSGNNPIYIKVTLEDGHLAWTSPVYLQI